MRYAFAYGLYAVAFVVALTAYTMTAYSIGWWSVLVVSLALSGVGAVVTFYRPARSH